MFVYLTRSWIIRSMTYVTKYSAYASPQPNRLLLNYPAKLQLGFESEVKPRLVRELGASLGQVLCMLHLTPHSRAPMPALQDQVPAYNNISENEHRRNPKDRNDREILRFHDD